MVEIAIADNEAFAVSDVDLTRPAPSYTADTLALLQEELGPEAELYFLMGMDSLAGILSWHRPAEIISRAILAIAMRPGTSADVAALEVALPGLSARIHYLHMPEIGISSRDLRQRVRAGLPIRYQVPESVEAYIHTNNLYREDTPVPSATVRGHIL
jgi:nicotinate-nucleotide adenylyltransferase